MKTCNGFIFILDALGASQFDEKKIESYLEGRSKINSLVSDVIKSAGRGKGIESCDIFTFGDTVLLAISVEKDAILPVEFVVPIYAMEIHLLLSFVSSQILYRGAFSVGQFYVDSESNTVMGPAVSDAASWYEASNVPAVISTPKCSVFIESNYERMNLENLATPVHRYPVPMKDGTTKELFVVAWLAQLFKKEVQLNFFKKEFENVDKVFFSTLEKFEIPTGTEKKYEGLIEYYDYTKNNPKIGTAGTNPKKKP